jgi:hypothetical protein
MTHNQLIKSVFDLVLTLEQECDDKHNEIKKLKESLNTLFDLLIKLSQDCDNKEKEIIKLKNIIDNSDSP